MSADNCRCGRRGLSFDRRQSLSALMGAGLGGVFFAAPREASAGATEAPPRPEDEGFMTLAIAEAAKGDFPFGALIVRDGKVAASARNLGRANNDPTAHAEMMAIRSFIATRPAAELAGATIYASGEPCPMCMGAILWSGFGRLVFAASIAQLATKIGQIMLPSREIADKAPFATITITGGVLAAESLALFK
jgi:guanine deaminase